MSGQPPNWYAVLGVPANATPVLIDHAYRTPRAAEVGRGCCSVLVTGVLKVFGKQRIDWPNRSRGLFSLEHQQTYARIGQPLNAAQSKRRPPLEPTTRTEQQRVRR
jgi:hypothetical protein